MCFVIRKMLHIKLDDDKWETLVKFEKFGIVGVSNTVVFYVIYVVSLLIFQKNSIMPNVDYLVAQELFLDFLYSIH